MPSVFLHHSLLYLYIYLVIETVSHFVSWNLLCRIGWLQIHRALPASVSRVLALKECTTMSSITLVFEIGSLTEPGTHLLGQTGWPDSPPYLFGFVPLHCWGYTHTPTPSSYVGGGESISGPHVCVASSSSTESLSPKCRVQILNIRNQEAVLVRQLKGTI